MRGRNGYNLKAMRFVLREKYKNPELRRILLNTDERKIIENTAIANRAENRDPF